MDGRNLSNKKPGAVSAPGQMAFALNQALFSGVQQRMPKHLAMLHARENNIRIMVLRNVIAFASFPKEYRSNFLVI